MANPLFARDKVDFRKKLRLSASSQTSSAVLDEAILQVRTVIFQELGESRVAFIRTIPYDEAASTDNAILRLSAAQVELFGTKARLLRDAPSFFMEAANSSEEAWNEEGLLRSNEGEEGAAYYNDLFVRGLEALASSGKPDSGISLRSVGPKNDAQKTIGKSLTSGKGLGGLWP